MLTQRKVNISTRYVLYFYPERHKKYSDNCWNKVFIESLKHKNSKFFCNLVVQDCSQTIFSGAKSIRNLGVKLPTF